MLMKNQNSNEKKAEKDPQAVQRNDTAGTGDDTLGENTEITPVAAAILKDKDASVKAKENQENKDPSERNG